MAAYPCFLFHFEKNTTAHISQTFRVGRRKIPVLRKAAWNRQGIRESVILLYGAALRLVIMVRNCPLLCCPRVPLITDMLLVKSSLRTYPGDHLPSHPQNSSAGSTMDSTQFLIRPNPVRLMPVVECIVPDAFTLIGSRKVAVLVMSENEFGPEP